MMNLAIAALAALLPAVHAAEWRTEVPAGRGAPALAAPGLRQADGEPMLDRQEASRTRLDLSAFESDWVERRAPGERGLKAMKFTKARRVTGLAAPAPAPEVPAAAKYAKYSEYEDELAAASPKPAPVPKRARARARGRAVAGRGSGRSAGSVTAAGTGASAAADAPAANTVEAASAPAPVPAPKPKRVKLATDEEVKYGTNNGVWAQAIGGQVWDPRLNRWVFTNETSSQGCEYGPHPEQSLSVGCRNVFKDGTKSTVVAFDGNKIYGARHKFIVEKDGEAFEEYYSPLVFDLNGDGVRMSRRSRKLDVDANRTQDDVNDVSASDGLLVLDTDRDGVYGEGGFELLGTGTDLDGDGKADGYKDGFAALKALVLLAEGRGLLARGTAASGRLGWSELLALQGGWGLRMKVGGMKANAVPVHDAGVLAIALPTEKCVRLKDFDGQGNETQRCEGAVFQRKDGTLGAYEDVWLAAN